MSTDSDTSTEPTLPSAGSSASRAKPRQEAAGLPCDVPEVMSPRRAALLLDLSVFTIYNALERGDLRGFKRRGSTHWTITREAFLDWAKGGDAPVPRRGTCDGRQPAGSASSSGDPHPEPRRDTPQPAPAEQDFEPVRTERVTDELRALANVVVDGPALCRRIFRTQDLALFDLHELPAQTLTLLSLEPGAGVTRIAERMAISKGGIAQVVKGLTARGLVSASPVPGDGRRRALDLTSAGEQLTARLIEHATSVVSRDRQGFASAVASADRVVAQAANDRTPCEDCDEAAQPLHDFAFEVNRLGMEDGLEPLDAIREVLSAASSSAVDNRR